MKYKYMSESCSHWGLACLINIRQETGWEFVQFASRQDCSDLVVLFRRAAL